MATWVPTDPQTAAIWEKFGWDVPNAHGAFLDVTLQLGLVGLGLLLTMIAVAWQQARACCSRGFFPRLVLANAHCGTTIVRHFGNRAGTKSGDILLNLFNFSCGLRLASQSRRGQ